MHLGRNGIRVPFTKPSHSSEPSVPHSPLASLLRGIVAPKRCLSRCLPECDWNASSSCMKAETRRCNVIKITPTCYFKYVDVQTASTLGPAVSLPA